MTRKEIKKVLDQHLLWIRTDGEEGKRANLTGADLSGADLSGANLTRANLTGADLTRANLSGADLSGANLTRANLTGADLSGANLTRANLTRADLSGADLSRANLTIIWNKYPCHLSWQGEIVCIRIGCECRPVKEYDGMKDELGAHHDPQWWNKHGKYIFDFLKEEAKRVEK